MIFCKPNTKILILLPEYSLTFFHFWQYVADISNVDIFYKDGKINVSSFKDIIDPYDHLSQKDQKFCTEMRKQEKENNM
jgi:hypothetical protein